MKHRRIVSSIILLLLVIAFAGCNKKPYKPEKIVADHSFINDDFDSHIELAGDIILTDSGLVVRQSITVIMRVVRGTGRKIEYYQIDWVSAAGDYQTYYNFARENDFRYRGQKFLPLMPVGGGALSEIKARFEYFHVLDGAPERKEYAYAEEMIVFPEDNFITDLTEIGDLVDFGVVLNDADPDQYRFKYYINHAKKDAPSHIDFQAWCETVDGLIFPAFGLYHYATFGKDYFSGSDKKISKEIEITNIYIKLKYYDGDFERRGQYKISLEELRTA
jgi:hypothetical protein